MKSNIIKVLGSIALLIVGLLFVHQCTRTQDKAEETAKVSAINAELQTVKNKNGQLVAQIQTIAVNQKEFKEIAFKRQDSLARLLQEEIRAHRGTAQAATIFKQEVTGKLAAKTTIQKPPVTIIEKEYIYPVYTANFLDKYYSADIIAGPDSTKLNFKYNSVISVIHSTRKHLFKRDELLTTIHDQNPYSRTVEVVSFKEPAPRKNTLASILLGAVLAEGARLGINKLSNQ